MKYFTSVSNHQVPYREDNPFPYGHLYQYVASWVLDGIVNYPEHVAGVVLACYSEDEEFSPDLFPARQSCQELRQKVISWIIKVMGGVVHYTKLSVIMWYCFHMKKQLMLIGFSILTVIVRIVQSADLKRQIQEKKY